MYVLMDSAASDFANSISVDRTGHVSSDLMTCLATLATPDVAFVEGFVVPAEHVAEQEALAAAIAAMEGEQQVTVGNDFHIE